MQPLSIVDILKLAFKVLADPIVRSDIAAIIKDPSQVAEYFAVVKELFILLGSPNSPIPLPTPTPVNPDPNNIPPMPSPPTA